MAKEKSMAAPGLMSEVFKFGIYKRNQGRYARQVTFFAFLVIIVLAAMQMSGQSYVNWFNGSRYILTAAFVLIMAFLDFRLVNYPPFADFLIAVEAEMYKVSWPSRRELVRSSIVVIGVIFIMASLLFFFDLIWRGVFDWLLGIGFGVIISIVGG